MDVLQILHNIPAECPIGFSRLPLPEKRKMFLSTADPVRCPPLDEVCSIIDAKSTVILSGREIIRRVTLRCGDKISNRWKKKTKEQRRKLLQEVVPAIPACHRPDFKAHCSKLRMSMDQKVAAYLCPNINLDDLEGPKMLLLMLESRANNDPCDFVKVDLDATTIGQANETINSYGMRSHVVVFTRKRLPGPYVNVLKAGNHQNLWYQINSFEAFWAGQGLIVLDAQEHTYRFLVKCCKAILHDLSWKDLLEDTSPIDAKSSLKVGSLDPYASLDIVACQAPYRKPAQVNLERLLDLVTGKLGAVNDHLLLLREDPGYFVKTLDEWREHRVENIRFKPGTDQSALRKRHDEDILFEATLEYMVNVACTEVEQWACLRELTSDFVNLAKECGQQISQNFDLADRLVLAGWKLWRTFEEFPNMPITNLTGGIPASPKWRHLCHLSICSNLSDSKRGRYKMEWRIEASRDKNILSLQRALSFLSSENLRSAYGLDLALLELNRLLAADSKQSLFTNWVADRVSDVAVYAECQREMRLIQPGPTTSGPGTKEDHYIVEHSLLKPAEHVESLFQVRFDGTLYELGKPSGTKFHYPAERRRTREMVQKMRQAEQNLDSFWAAYAESLRAAGNVHPCLMELLTCEVSRTPEYEQPARTSPVLYEQCDTGDVVKSIRELDLERERRTESTVDRKWMPIYQSKAKTHGTACPLVTINNDLDNTALDSSIPRSRILVSERALKVFRTIFFDPSRGSHPGEVAWKDFLYAMTSAGFASRHRFGSVWQFSPMGPDHHCAIHFHRPHPVPSLSYVVARAIGRRLSYSYGWSHETFILKPKVAGGDNKEKG